MVSGKSNTFTNYAVRSALSRYLTATCGLLVVLRRRTIANN